MRKLSLKIRLILSFLGIAAVIWSAAAILAWHESREQMDEFFDTYQLMLARQLSTADWRDINQKKVDNLIDSLGDDGEEDDEALGLAVFNTNGQMVFHDDEHGQNFKYTPNVSGFENQPLGRKQKMWRLVWIKSIDGQHTIAIGQEMEYRNEAALEMVEEALVPWLCGLGTLLMAIIWLITREFRPLNKIAKDLSLRNSDDLSPLTQDNVPQEIKPLINAMNDLLARLKKMLQRERCFIADAAHELRSPLTALKVQLEVAELSTDDKKAQKKALKNLKEGVERSTHLVEQMLALSKLETTSNATDEDILDWKNLVKQTIAEQSVDIQNKDIAVSWQISNPTFLAKGQTFLWSLLLRNLLDNAVRYSGKKANIVINITDKNLVVSNDKTKIEKAHISRLGERFFRPSGQKVKGSGLGLSIVEKIATLHHCQVDYKYNDDVFNVIISAKD